MNSHEPAQKKICFSDMLRTVPISTNVHGCAALCTRWRSSLFSCVTSCGGVVSCEHRVNSKRDREYKNIHSLWDNITVPCERYHIVSQGIVGTAAINERVSRKFFSPKIFTVKP